jgi:hypothetical protein
LTCGRRTPDAESVGLSSRPLEEQGEIMLFKRSYALLSVIVALALAILACGGGGQAPATDAPATRTPRPATAEVVEEPTEEPEEEPTEEPEEEPTEEPEEEPTEEPEDEPTEPSGIVAGEIGVNSLYGYLDEYNYYHVVGTIFNNTEEPVTNIELTLELIDAGGESVLTDFDDNPVDSVTFSPFLYTLAQGETSPFDYYVNVEDEDTEEWSPTVTVTGSDEGDVDRAEMEIVNDQFSEDEFGTLYLSGELVNLSDEPVLVNSLAGALADADDLILAADASYSLARYLAPAGDENGNDRTPFVISLDGPADTAETSYFYWDVDITEPIDTALDVTIDLANAFIDDFDDLHVIAEVGNEGDLVLAIQLVAGLYAEDGTVLDAATVSAPIYIGPGESIPLSFDYFSSVNSNAEELDRVDSYTVQIDSYWTYETTVEVVALETANETSETFGEGQVTFTGDVLNTSTENLSSATLILALYDTEDNLVTSSWTSVYPEGDSFAPEASLPFELTIYLPPGEDTSGYTFFTFVQGYVK